MSSTEEVLDKAIGIMQDTSMRLLGICKDKMHNGKSLNVLEVKELRELIEAIAEGLDQDSLLRLSIVQIDLMADPFNVDLSSSSKKGKDCSVHEDEVLTDAYLEATQKKQKKISNSTPGSSTSSANASRFKYEATDPNIEIVISETRPIGRKEAKALRAKLLHRWPMVLRKRR